MLLREQIADGDAALGAGFENARARRPQIQVLRRAWSIRPLSVASSNTVHQVQSAAGWLITRGSALSTQLGATRRRWLGIVRADFAARCATIAVSDVQPQAAIADATSTNAMTPGARLGHAVAARGAGRAGRRQLGWRYRRAHGENRWAIAIEAKGWRRSGVSGPRERRTCGGRCISGQRQAQPARSLQALLSALLGNPRKAA